MSKRKSKKRPVDQLQYIDSYKSRVTTYSKRKRSLFKKAIELSILCDLDIFLLIFDKNKQKFFELNSDPQFDSNIVQNLLSKTNRQQFIQKRYTNADHHLFCIDKLGKDSGPEDEEDPSDLDDDDLYDEQGVSNVAEQLEKSQQRLKDFDKIIQQYIIPSKQATKYREKYLNQKQNDQAEQNPAEPVQQPIQPLATKVQPAKIPNYDISNFSKMEIEGDVSISEQVIKHQKFEASGLCHERHFIKCNKVKVGFHIIQCSPKKRGRKCLKVESSEKESYVSESQSQTSSMSNHKKKRDKKTEEKQKLIINIEKSESSLEQIYEQKPVNEPIKIQSSTNAQELQPKPAQTIQIQEMKAAKSPINPLEVFQQNNAQSLSYQILRNQQLKNMGMTAPANEPEKQKPLEKVNIAQNIQQPSKMSFNMQSFMKPIQLDQIDQNVLEKVPTNPFEQYLKFVTNSKANSKFNQIGEPISNQAKIPQYGSQYLDELQKRSERFSQQINNMNQKYYDQHHYINQNYLQLNHSSNNFEAPKPLNMQKQDQNPQPQQQALDANSIIKSIQEKQRKQNGNPSYE